MLQGSVYPSHRLVKSQIHTFLGSQSHKITPFVFPRVTESVRCAPCRARCAQGEPAWDIQPETVTEVADLSLNFFFILPLLNQGGEERNYCLSP